MFMGLPVAPSLAGDAAGGCASNKRAPLVRGGEPRSEIRGMSGLVRLSDPGGERVSRFRSSLAVKKRGIRILGLHQLINIRETRVSGTHRRGEEDDTHIGGSGRCLNREREQPMEDSPYIGPGSGGGCPCDVRRGDSRDSNGGPPPGGVA
jgi:hypothetical protein